jgi:hypothetical protein
MSSATNDSANAIGGGAVNEKKRLFPEKGLLSKEKSGVVEDEQTLSSSAYDPMQHRAHLLHALEGLDRYPNYLSRWQDDDIDLLEGALQERLKQVREHKSKMTQQRLEMKQLLQEFLNQHSEWKDFVQAPSTWEEIQSAILHPRANETIFRSKFFQLKRDGVSVEDVLSGKTPVILDAAFLQELMDEEVFDVYSFPLLSSDFCHKLHRFVSAFMSHLESSPSLQSPTRGIHKDLDNMGMKWLNDLLFQLVVRPISSHLYKDTELEGGDLDWRQGFVASYSADPTQSKPRQRLVPHTDDAEVSHHE